MIGETVAHYRITAKLGEGGMGAVYRATDTKLKREVALKVLPDAFAGDPERMARFQREAEVLASLNHPNIAHIYGVEDRALVMELVEGESPKGPLAFDDAWKIASQIADALDYAHERGIVHRDLKPANVKVTPDGVVKLLDFGLAKAFTSPAAVSSSVENSPTLTLGATQLGVILGTAGYMAPEQAKGKSVDKRADIWSFGVVLYELLTGQRLFHGEDVSDTLAQVLTKQPELEPVPAPARKLLRRCLEKDPKKRLRDIGEARYLIESGTDSPAQAASLPHSRLWPAVAAVAAAAAIAAGAWAWLHRPPADTQSLRYNIEAPPDTRFSNLAFGAAVSPDGRLLVYSAAGAGRSANTIWLRPLDALAARELPGSEGGSGMFWSPDSKSIGFIAQVENKLKRVDVLGGAPQELCDAVAFQGGSWGRDGTILFSASNVIQRVPATGGTPTPVTSLDLQRQETQHRAPSFLPDGKSFLFTVASSKAGVQGIYAAPLDAPKQRVRLAASSFKGVYAPPRNGGPGELLWVRDSTLVAQRFDGKTRVEGDPVNLVEDVTGNPLGRAPFWLSDTGLLVYRAGGGSGLELDWVSRDGKREVIPAAGVDPQRGNPRLSPDGARVAFDRAAATGPSSKIDVWLYEFARGGVLTRLTTGPGNNSAPVWSPDSRQVAFSSDRGGVLQIYRIDSTGTGQAERLTDGPNPKTPLDWSRDGRYLLYQEQDPKTGYDIWALPLEGDRKPLPVLHTSFNEREAQFSPDGKWIAYVSDETGAARVYVQSFPPSEKKRPVSNTDALQPRWQGNQIYYYTGSQHLWSAVVRAAPGDLQIDTPRELPVLYSRFSGPIYYDVTGDGQRLLEIQRPAGGQDQLANALTVVSNWQSVLQR